jgi:uncharacterized protein YjbI with pentapeptide repeats
MNPAVVAAVIAAAVSVLTLIGSLAAQLYGMRKTSGDTEKTLNQQREQLDRTLAEQREHLDRTLAEQREHLDRTLAEQRTRTLNERFATAAGQLGSDKPPAVRLAGVYAMAGLADDWKENRQTCVEVLCAYLRMPYVPDPGQDAPAPERLAFRSSREVRHTVIRVIAAHLRDNAAVSWQGLNFDFTGVVLDGGDFSEAEFSGGTVSFAGAEFSGGTVEFGGARFSGGKVGFRGAEFSGGTVRFSVAEFSGSEVDFSEAQFSGGTIRFSDAEFSGGEVDFSEAQFSAGQVWFGGAEFSGGIVRFSDAQFSGGETSFRDAQFCGARVDFQDAEFSGGAVDFSHPVDWSFPPRFAQPDAPSPGVKLPEPARQPGQRAV